MWNHQSSDGGCYLVEAHDFVTLEIVPFLVHTDAFRAEELTAVFTVSIGISCYTVVAGVLLRIGDFLL